MNIELAGASGVGKTTALRSISDALHTSMEVTSGDVLLSSMQEKEHEFSALHWSTLADDGAVFLRTDFISEYLCRIQKMSGKDTQKLNLVKFIDKHRKDFLVREQLHAKHLLIDEGLVHASFPISQFSLNLSNDIAFFLESIPLPSVVIQLHAEPERILNRIKARGKVVNSYRYANDTLLMSRLGRVESYLLLMEKVLIRRGCRVRRVDANGPVKEWSQAIMDIVKEEITRQPASPQSSLTLNFDNTFTPENTLGLDFSLPEDRHSH